MSMDADKAKTGRCARPGCLSQATGEHSYVGHEFCSPECLGLYKALVSKWVTGEGALPPSGERCKEHSEYYYADCPKCFPPETSEQRPDRWMRIVTAGVLVWAVYVVARLVWRLW